ncbi:MAG: hypothetical protein AAF609_01960 [Cyanobacteria bacterium P01_C01_bin.120]
MSPSETGSRVRVCSSDGGHIVGLTQSADTARSPIVIAKLVTSA